MRRPVGDHLRDMSATTPCRLAATLLAALFLALLGCGGGETERHRHPRAGLGTAGHEALGPVVHAHHRHRHPQPERKPRPPAPPAYASVCPPRPRTLAGVYHPYRLRVLDPCRRVTGSVETVDDETDGDVHLGVRLDPPYRGMLLRANRTVQAGNLVVELMPRDHGRIAAPSVGDRVTLIGAYVDDTDHGWAEIHPVFGLSRNGGPLQRSGPRFGGSPAFASSDDALATCRTAAGGRCTGYGGASPPAKARAPSPRPAGGRCDPSYAGACLDPNASDYDCAGAGGDGPRYVGRVRIVGTDHFNLDSDGDGIGCE